MRRGKRGIIIPTERAGRPLHQILSREVRRAHSKAHIVRAPPHPSGTVLLLLPARPAASPVKVVDDVAPIHYFAEKIPEICPRDLKRETHASTDAGARRHQRRVKSSVHLARGHVPLFGGRHPITTHHDKSGDANGALARATCWVQFLTVK